MTIAELQQSINTVLGLGDLFVEAIEKLQTDKIEALAAAEEAAVAAASLLFGAIEGVNATATALKSGIDALVAEVVG